LVYGKNLKTTEYKTTEYKYDLGILTESDGEDAELSVIWAEW
jgi:hypothetical protein